MPVVQASNNYLAGLAKQTNEATTASVAAYSFPVFAASIAPTQTINRVEVTDAASVIGDPYKAPGEHWTGEFEAPAFDNALGTMLVSLWGTDTASGTAPSKVHTFTGLGGVQPWMAAYTEWPASTFEQTFGKGLCTGMSFVFGPDGGPLRVVWRGIGQTPTVAAWTVTTAATLADGFFTATGGNLKMEVDNATPVQVTNIRSVTVNVDRPGEPVASADGLTSANLSVGRVDPTFSMELIWNSWEEYRATFYGAVGGSAASATIVKGSLDLNFVHSVSGTSLFRILMPSAVFAAEPVNPDPSGSPMLVTVNGYATKPGSGEHIQPILTNNVTPAY